MDERADATEERADDCWLRTEDMALEALVAAELAAELAPVVPWAAAAPKRAAMM
jgi:hypothetical protein